MAKVRLPDVYVEPELADAIRRLADGREATYAELARTALRLLLALEVERAVRAARAGTARQCPVCREPRRADGVEDSLAHAQCDVIVGDIERRAKAA